MPRTRRNLGLEILKHLVEKGMKEKEALAATRKIAEVFGKLEDEKADNASYIRQLAFISPNEREAAFALADKAARGEGDRSATRCHFG